MVTVLIARSQLHAARSDADDLQSALLSGNLSAARQAADRLEGHASGAHSRTTGPAWWLGSHLPAVGPPIRSIRGVSATVDDLARAVVPPTLRAAGDLTPDRLLLGPGQFDLAAISSMADPIRDATAAVHAADQQLADVPRDTWLGFVDNQRQDVAHDITRLGDALDQATEATSVIPAMLGAHGERRYFVAFQNGAEARGLGGLPGAYGILSADHGALEFVRFGPEEDLLGARSHADLGPDFRSRYVKGFGANTEYRNSDASPHFPYAAVTWLSMWEDKFDQRLDGALTVDPTALSYLLRATGSVTLSDGQKLVPDNVALVLESDVYAKFPGLSHASINARKAYLVEAASRIVDTVTRNADKQPRTLVDALGRAVGERRLLAYSAHPKEQKFLAGTPLAGLLPRTDRPFVSLAINNGAGSKLDYYLDRRLTYQRSTCGPTTATVTVTLHNDAPTHGLPAYVTYTEGLPKSGPPGQNYELVALYLTHGAELKSVTLDGKKQFLQESNELGHPVISLGVRLLPGQSRTLRYSIKEPAATGPLVIPVQPMVRGIDAHIDMPPCAVTDG